MLIIAEKEALKDQRASTGQEVLLTASQSYGPASTDQAPVVADEMLVCRLLSDRNHVYPNLPQLTPCAEKYGLTARMQM